MSSKKIRERVPLIIICLIVAACASAAPAQEQEQGGAHGIRSEEVIERPTKTPVTSTPSNRPPAGKPRRRVTYRSSKPFIKSAPPRGTEEAKLGVTIWRLQADVSKGAGRPDEEASTLEQLAVGTPLSIGSNLRLGIEALTRDGYLYVVDREQFADGSYGTPHLIFPTLRTHNGDNHIRVNERILIPRRPAYFRINPSSSGKRQVAEILTLIVSPAPLSLPAPLGDKPLTLSAQLLSDWETRWSVPFTQFEMEGTGHVIAARELDQSGDEAHQLTEEDPLPQTIYRAMIRKGNSLLVTVPLRFK